MSTTLILLLVAAYFLVIFTISFITGKKGSQDFFKGGRKSPWYIVAISMVGTSISGVTFLSVPGMVAASQFSYMQMVLGFTAGYIVISYVLLPLYYSMDMNSIYGYLEQRFGREGYFTGASFFLLSKLLGCGVRMYLTAAVLQWIVFDSIGVPFWVNASVTMAIVWLYTFRGGVKTLVWTDLMQTLAMIAAVVLCIIHICKAMELDANGLWQSVRESEMSRIWFFDDARDTRFFWKQFLAGMFTTIAMTGLDQDMMQKNLSCKNLKDAQKNVITNGMLYIPVNIIFLALGVLLYQFAASRGIECKADQLFATVATGGYAPDIVGILFVLGLVAAAFSSAGSALTALTTSFTVDILRADRNGNEKQLSRTRVIVHCFAALLMAVMICAFRLIGNGSVINAVYTIAGFTYGPLLGLYAFGMFTKRKPRSRTVPLICVASPLVCLALQLGSEAWWHYEFGFEMLLINAAITFTGVWLSAPKRVR